ncbi:hypothetical protein, partial [Pseudomonas aeruginosa]|uniref:hypothetical protein n=1 Tax=Pseudomonas aeruginosa TaxID=287 RepID=UPI002359C96B
EGADEGAAWWQWPCAVLDSQPLIGLPFDPSSLPLPVAKRLEGSYLGNYYLMTVVTACIVSS